MDDGEPSPPGHSADPKQESLDQGRRYWKAAIAHLAPEKREAAWEFYLDRLESSAAADTLGGVMLLLEAHLAFFDDLPARLAAAVGQMQAAVAATGNPTPSAGLPPDAKTVAVGGGPALPAWRASRWALATIFAALGALLGGTAVFSRQHFQPAAHISSPAKTPEVLLPRGVHAISVQPWYDPAVQRQRGCVVCFERAAWSEATPDGGAKVYVLSPVEEVRRDLEILRQMTPAPVPKVP